MIKMDEIKFPLPWKLIFVGDAYRVFDANNRELFVICGDEYTVDDQEEEVYTVLVHGKDAEIEALDDALIEFFEKGNK